MANMNQLLPIIRRVRRPLLPLEEPRAASVPLVAGPDASKMLAAPGPTLPLSAEPASEPTPAPPPLASKKKAHAPRSLQTAAAS